LPLKEEREETGPHVKFASQDVIQTLTDAQPPKEGTDQIDEADSSASSGSGRSTPTLDASDTTFQIERTFASRLSFWTRLSKRTSLGHLSTPSVITEQDESSEPMILEENEIKPLDSTMDGNTDPAAVLRTVVEQAAPPPATQEERYSELEERIVKECVREFSKGGMYFTHNFGP
jgi:phosphatidylinositol 4-phosphatase